MVYKKAMILFLLLSIIGCTETVYVDRNITVEKIVPAECEVCVPCKPCEPSNITCPECVECEECVPCEDEDYILGLIREAKRCEKSQYYANLSVCTSDYNNTKSDLKDCSFQLCKYNNSWCNK